MDRHRGMGTMVVAGLLALAAACSSSGDGAATPASSAPHLHHLRGGTYGSGGACSDCHSATGFAVDFSQDPLVRAGGATFDPVTLTCSAVYCHGSFTLLGVSGTRASIAWNGALSGCADCHAMPPDGHPALPGPATPASCSSCHPQTVDAQGRILVAAGLHVDGQAQTSGPGCAGCHGDAGRTGSRPGTDPNLASSPPVAPTGAPAYAVGAHLGHLDPAVATALMPPIACAECHPVPVDSTHATRPPPRRVVFGPLSVLGGASPTWDAATGTCAATYCHGSFAFDGVTGTSAAIAWNDPAPMTCASCHAMPPTGHPAYTGTPTAASCAACHPQSVNPDGTILAGGGHLDGRAQGGDCGSCHGDPPATGRHGEERHVTLRCDACHPTGFASDAAVAPLHRNGVVDLGSQAGYSCGLTGCPAGVQGTCTNSCHAQPQPWTGQGGGG